ARRGVVPMNLIPLFLWVGAMTSLQTSTEADLAKMSARFAPVELRADVSALSPGDRATLAKLIEAARIVDVLQLRQRWSKNDARMAALEKDKSAIGKARLQYFWLNKGPWSILDDTKAFLPATAGIEIPAQKLGGANFYPEDASREEIDAWMKSLPDAERDK